MTVHLTRPELSFPPHEITTEEIVADIEARHAGHPRLAAVRRALSHVGVERRRMMRPLDAATVSGTAGITERNRAAFADATEHAATAATGLLRRTGLAPADVDAVVTSHTTSWSSPNLDVALANRLGLRPDVRRLPLSSLGCAGGAHALAKAADHLAARPGDRVLVVVAETLSTVYSHHDTSLESMIYKALFGDSAAAVLVTAAPLEPAGFAAGDTWEFLLPDSADRYRGRLDDAGLHFDSTRRALAGVDDVLPHLHTWLDRTGHKPHWAVIHPGGPRILDDTAAGLDLTGGDLRHSWDSLRERGNLGGAAVLDVLARTHSDPPTPGTPGLLLGLGPGFAATALSGTWRDDRPHQP
ncbi:PhlD [Streptomyces sp. JJ36]|uniref:PhlD n=1 Tax=Streptomyces sp. JJ36 TaxID=2736645 RepID=UPI001F1A842A|nr:PhlD [Streptomyces sp. JJ36]MCF6521839.1 PhlD [Streptomyces sp. JJ36]